MAAPEKPPIVESDQSPLKQAAEAGDITAQSNLGLAYYVGVAVPKDAGMAAFWFEKAASKGFSAAQYNLAGLYATGEGGGSER